jgi:hypothetical protein
MVKNFLGIDPGRGQEGLKSLTLCIFLEYLCVCVCVCVFVYLYLTIL